MNILVIGAGVSGLSCAVRLLEAGRRDQVLARDLPRETTSAVAAAVWYPYKAYPEHLVLGWSAATSAELVRLAEDPAAGVDVRPGVDSPARVPDPWWRSAAPDFRRAAEAELPPGCARRFVFSAPVVEMPVYLGYLQARVARLGGAVERGVLGGAAELDAGLGAHDAVVNCAGLGARELLGDRELAPIRGQIVRVAQGGRGALHVDDHRAGGVTYIVPRRSGHRAWAARRSRATSAPSRTRRRRRQSWSAAQRSSRACAARRCRAPRRPAAGAHQHAAQRPSGAPAGCLCTTTATAAQGSRSRGAAQTRWRRW